MNRSSFIRGLIGAFGLSVVPIHLITQYQKIYLLQCFVRGFRFYDGENNLHEMKEGDMLELVREPSNEHDTNAIALHFNRNKIGYVPRESNEILSRLIDADVTELQAEITHIEKKAKAWESLHIAIYVLKEYIGTPNESPIYLTQLETPHYHTLKHTDNTLSRIYYDEESDDCYSAENFYEDMVKNSSNDEVYDLLHHNIDAQKLDEAVNQNLFITKQKDLPLFVNENDVIKVIDDTIITLDGYFKEDGLVMVNVERLAQFPNFISGFVDIADKQGNKFIEVLFKNI